MRTVNASRRQERFDAVVRAVGCDSCRLRQKVGRHGGVSAERPGLSDPGLSALRDDEGEVAVNTFSPVITGLVPGIHEHSRLRPF